MIFALHYNQLIILGIVTIHTKAWKLLVPEIPLLYGIKWFMFELRIFPDI